VESEDDIGLSAESIPASKDLEIPQLTLKAASGKPLIDGHINDPFWEQAEAFELSFELYPERLTPASVKTDALVSATKTHLYLAFIANDPDPEHLPAAQCTIKLGAETKSYCPIIKTVTALLPNLWMGATS
jgi:hypothetical protein